MSRSNDVGGYRGRRTITDILKIIAAVLAVAVVVVLAGLLYLQKYIVYTDEGPKLELPPFLQMFRGEEGPEEPSVGAASSGAGDVSFTEDPAGSQQTVPEPPPEPEPAGFALALTVDQVLDGTAAARLEEAGASALILTMKDQSGKLAWLSSHDTAGRARVNGRQEVNDALAQWNSGEVYTIARVCCFRDDSVPYFRNPLALRRGNGNWRDELGLRWMSPANEEAQAYVAALCGELAALGFDEIVLEDFSFPIRGKLENINTGDSYDPASFGQALESFLDQVQQAAAPYGTKISLRVERDTLVGAETASGVTAPLLERFAARIWMVQDGLLPAPADLLAQAGIAGGPDRLVEVTAAHQAESQIFQAEIP